MRWVVGRVAEGRMGGGGSLEMPAMEQEKRVQPKKLYPFLLLMWAF